MKMALLKLAENKPGVDYIEYRDINFFNKFRYRAKIRFEGLQLTYYSENIDQFTKKVKNANLRWRRLDKDKVLSDLTFVQEYLDFKSTIKGDKNFVIRIEGDTAGIFSNNLDKLLELKKIKGLDADITEAELSQHCGVKYFVREPKHKYRAYFRSQPVEHSTIETVKETLVKKKNLFPSKSLQQWLFKTRQMQWHYKYCSSSYYIDYDDESTLSYLALMFGHILGRKYKLEKRPVNE